MSDAGPRKIACKQAPTHRRRNRGQGELSVARSNARSLVRECFGWVFGSMVGEESEGAAGLRDAGPGSAKPATVLAAGHQRS